MQPRCRLLRKPARPAVSIKNVRVLQEMKLSQLIAGNNCHTGCNGPSKAEPRSHDSTWILHSVKKLERATTARDPTSIVLRRAGDPPSDKGDAKATARVPGSEQERKLSVSLARDRKFGGGARRWTRAGCRRKEWRGMSIDDEYGPYQAL
ncbi:hypothetical protein PM082_012475 [Marasmius tenuissimus]|nr:hypothetical protein PM082_012475 [Marasmius tenuissimus]